MTQAFHVTNLAIAAAPASYHLPNDAGVTVPAGLHAWDLAIDLGGTVPAGQTFSVGMEYQRDAWTDSNGVLHAAGEWLPDASADMTTGSYTPKNNIPTTINHLASSIGAVKTDGGMVEPYPTHARLRVDAAGAWTLPSVTLNIT